MPTSGSSSIWNRKKPTAHDRGSVQKSGGQRAKLLFPDMVLRKADVLPDEATRNFSPLSALAVRAALRKFGGSVLSVSHDRKYLSEVCDTVYEPRPDGLYRIDPPE